MRSPAVPDMPTQSRGHATRRPAAVEPSRTRKAAMGQRARPPRQLFLCGAPAAALGAFLALAPARALQPDAARPDGPAAGGSARDLFGARSEAMRTRGGRTRVGA